MTQMIAQAQLTFDKVLTFETGTGRPPGVCFSNFLSCKSFVDTELLQWGFLGMLGIFYMHHHIDMITHGLPLLNQTSALVGTS